MCDGSLTGMVVDDLLKSLLDDYQFSLRTKMKKSNLVYNRVRTFHYKLRKISINRSDGLYIDSPDWIKNRFIKTMINAHSMQYLSH